MPDQPDYLLDEPSKPMARLLLAHGAGAPMDSDFMNELADALSAVGVAVVRFEFDYMAKRRVDGKRRPPAPFPRIVEQFEAVVAAWANRELPLFVAGKSMGGRAAASLCTASISGAIAYGYPLHPAAKPEKLRLAPLERRESPLCVIQGERDKLGDRARFQACGPWPEVELVWLADGDHDLKPRKASGFTHSQHILAAAAASRAFVERQLNLC